MAVVNSKDVKRKEWILLYGPKKHGKTHTAATASKFFPRETGRGPVDLSDLLFWQFDQSGMGTLDERFITVPMIDLRDQSSEGVIKKGVMQAIADTRAYVAKGQCEYLVIDGLSTLCKSLVGNLKLKYGEKYGLYDDLLAFFQQTLAQLSSIPVPIIFIAHSKYLSETALEKRAALGTPGNVAVDIDLDGSVFSFLPGQCGTIMPVLTSVVSGKEVRAMLPYGGKGFAGGTHKVGLPREVPNDLAAFMKMGSIQS